MKKIFANKTLSEKITYSVVFIIFSLFALSYLYMVFWCLYSGMRDFVSMSREPFGFSPIRLYNYVEVFTIMDANGSSFVEMLLNSLYFSFLGPFCCIFITCALSYVTSMYRFKGSTVIYFVIFFSILLPLYGTGTSQYRLLYNLGFINSRLMLITSFNGHNMNYLYFFAFFTNMSRSYVEAAEIDGANEWQTYFRIILPQTVTMFGSLFILLWMADWNNYGTALIYMPKLPTLAVGIYQFELQTRYNGRLDILYAACTISILPPLVIFILCNNTLMSNVSLGGIKE